ncbi:glycosyltransferase [Pseudomonas sp. TE3610]
MSTARAIDLSIIIPTYNEALLVQGQPRIWRTLRKLTGYLHGNAPELDFEIIVVDAQSPDGTAGVVRSLLGGYPMLRLIEASPKPAGQFTKGRQVALGMLSARGRYALFMDADLATPLPHLQQVFALMQRGEPIGIGVRPLQGAHRGLRQRISRLGNWLAQGLLVPGIDDTQCGFKVLRRDVARQLFALQRIEGFGFDLELLALARHFGYPVSMLPIADWCDVEQGSKLAAGAVLRVAPGVLLDLLKVAWGLRTGAYHAPRISPAPGQ